MALGIWSDAANESEENNVIDHVRAALPARVRRRLGAGIGLVAASVALAAAVASAATHEYCNWDGSYNFTSGGTSCFQSGDNYLTNNHAYLPYQPVSPTIYCAANNNGVQYGGWSSGWPYCDHAYGGGVLLKAKEQVDTSATTHGVISY